MGEARRIRLHVVQQLTDPIVDLSFMDDRLECLELGAARALSERGHPHLRVPLEEELRPLEIVDLRQTPFELGERVFHGPHVVLYVRANVRRPTSSSAWPSQA